MSTDRFDKRSGNEVLRDMCDEVFGKGMVPIEKWWAWNDMTIMLSFPVDFADFIEQFKKRLMRLKMRFEHKASYPMVLKTVAQLTEKKHCEKAYAKLAAWDILWNNYLMLGMEVDEKGRGHLEDYGMYFDVSPVMKIMDGSVLKRTMKDGLYVEVLVNAPIYCNSHIDHNKTCDGYYEKLAEKMFCENAKSMKNLAGFIVIDDGIDKDWYQCHTFMNPNAAHKNSLTDFYLDTLNCGREDLGILGSFFDYLGGSL